MSDIDYIILGVAAFVAGCWLAKLHTRSKRDQEEYLDLHQDIKYH